MRTLWIASVFVVLAGCAASWGPAPPNPNSTSSVGPASAWHDLPLPGKQRTRYTNLIEHGLPVVLAESHASASMLRRTVRVEPASLGQVKFSWRVPSLIESADLTDRDASTIHRFD